MPTSVDNIVIIKVHDLDQNEESDLLATEEPLEIRIGFGPLENREEVPLAVTMRTPGDDFNLVRGFLFSENIIDDISRIVSIQHCQKVKAEELNNVVRVELLPGMEFDVVKHQRNFYTTSSCGVCGKSSMESVHQVCNIIEGNWAIQKKEIHQAPEKLRQAQLIFEHTGGIHACGLFNIKGELLLMREDIGRHNAMDKLIGAALEGHVDLDKTFVLVSGRASFELVQKAAVAGIPLLAAVGAPSSLAVNLAKELNMTLLGFVRNNSFNIYTGVQRISND